MHGSATHLRSAPRVLLIELVYELVVLCILQVAALSVGRERVLGAAYEEATSRLATVRGLQPRRSSLGSVGRLAALRLRLRAARNGLLGDRSASRLTAVLRLQTHSRLFRRA